MPASEIPDLARKGRGAVSSLKNGADGNLEHARGLLLGGAFTLSVGGVALALLQLFPDQSPRNPA